MSNHLSHLKSLKMYAYTKTYRTASDPSVPKVTLATRHCSMEFNGYERL